MIKTVPSYKKLNPTTWEILSISKKIKEEGVKPSMAYPMDVYLTIINKALFCKWSFHVVCRIEYIDVLGDAWEKVVELEYKVNTPVTLKAASDMLTLALREEIKDDFFNTMPDTIHVTATGFIQVGTKNVRNSNNSRRKNRS